MKYPLDLEISHDDFVASGAQTIITAFYSLNEHHERSLDREFAIAATQATENKQDGHAKALWLLSCAASLRLNPDSFNDPLRPYAQWTDGSRSASIDDFSETDILWFSTVVERLDNCLFKARLADIVWLKKRNIKFALAAIEAYQTKDLNFLTWIRGGSESWRRAVELTLSIGKAAAPQLEQLETNLLEGFRIGLTEQGFLSIQIAKLLNEKRLNISHAESIADSLFNLAENHFNADEFFHSGQHFEHASHWFERTKLSDKATIANVRRAESLANGAKVRAEGENGSFLGAQPLYEKAIQAYRAIPKKARAVHDIDLKIEILRKAMIEVAGRGRQEMQALSIPVDRGSLEQLASYAIEEVKEKPCLDALICFANLQEFAKYSALKEDAVNDLKKSLAFLISGGSQTLASDGRVIAKNENTSGLSNRNDPSPAAINAQMIRSHVLHVGICSHSIYAALQTLQFEHRLPKVFFISLARESGAVPRDRCTLFGQALFAGYDGDFVVACHLLIPQIEHFVRMHLKQAGAITASLNKEGVEHENGLSTLIDLPEAVQVFGEDLIFEFRALLCDSNGPNLRNNLAHGLLDLNESQSPAVVYVWWLCLKLVMSSWWNIKNIPD